MFFFPVVFIGVDRFTGIQPLKRECRYLILSLLVGLDTALQISFHSEAFCLCPGSKFRFQFWMKSDAHDISSHERIYALIDRTVTWRQCVSFCGLFSKNLWGC
jgi:hypothetical protein